MCVSILDRNDTYCDVTCRNINLKPDVETNKTAQITV